MSTRGAVGFRINGQDKVAYNHHDSYPVFLGNQVLSAIKNMVLSPEVRQSVAAIRLVDGEDMPSAEAIEAMKPFVDLNTAELKNADWYTIMGKLQGDLISYASCGYMPDNQTFLKNSLFCEYAYIVNLDNDTLEFYVGFNKSPDAPGRYASLCAVGGDKKYYGVRLAQTIPLADIQADKVAVSPTAFDDEDNAFIYVKQ